jgi:hypothetical protein
MRGKFLRRGINTKLAKAAKVDRGNSRMNLAAE